MRRVWLAVRPASVSRGRAEALLLDAVPAARLVPTAAHAGGLSGSATVRRCPRCSERLRPETDGDGRQLDQCPRCELVVPLWVARPGPAVCRQCGERFTPRRRWHVYCDASCRARAWRTQTRLRGAEFGEPRSPERAPWPTSERSERKRSTVSRTA